MKSLCAVAVALSLLCGLALASAPNLVYYQGRLKDAFGNPVSDGTHSVVFAIYSDYADTVALWTETQSVSTSGGLFTVLLGRGTPLTASLFYDSSRYLGITVDTDPEVFPRVRFTSTPYSFYSVNSEMLGGVPSGGFALAAHTHTLSSLSDVSAPSPAGGQVLTYNAGASHWEPATPSVSGSSGWVDDGSVVRLETATDSVGIGTSAPLRPLHVSDASGGIYVARIESSNSGATVSELANTSAGSVWEMSVAGSDGIPGWGVQPGDFYMYKQGTIFPALSLTSARNLGLGTALPRAKIEAVTLDTIAGSFVAAAASNATKVLRAEYTGSGPYDAAAVYGKCTPADAHGYGGYFEGGRAGVLGTVSQNGPSGYSGIFGTASGSGSGLKIGARGLAYGDGGDNYGVSGEAAGSGNRIGVYGQAGGNFNAWGGYFFVSGQTNYGVVGIAQGSNTTGGAFSATGDLSYGLYASATGTSANAAYFAGNVFVTGSVSKSGGSFTIDHPLDPENKYLQHSFVESPDMKNIYDGVATLDANGQATVTLPDWFGALNKDFRYQLTCVGGYAPVYISSKVAHNKFSIAGGTPGLEISWQLTGIRKDLYAEAHRIQVELDKRPDEKGKYILPELYGKGPEMGIAYRPEMDSRLASSRSPARSTDESAPMKK